MGMREGVSIHALVKRATFVLSGQYFRIMDFNPRPREEGDLNYNDRRLQIQYFNPRPREEGDKRGQSDGNERRCFNPRPREEGDTHFYCFVNYLFWISIHALVKRATSTTNVTERDLLFQSTPS